MNLGKPEVSVAPGPLPWVRTTRRLVVALSLLGSLCLSCHREADSPNVLLITLDTTRADRLGCYGYADASTPHLDRIAEEGILFLEAVTPVPTTLPSHCTLLTGQVPLRHGVRNNGSYCLAPSVQTVVECFQEEGYQTAAFVSAFVLDAQFGVAQGFETYDDEFFNERPGPRTVARAIDWLLQHEGKPYFLWIHLFDPHTPWTPAAPYRDLPLPTDYDREIAMADGAVGQILEHLRISQTLEKTILAVIGDHGEGLNDHDEAEHGIFLYRESIRLPFILRLPGSESAGTQIPHLVGAVDLAPTLCDLAGVPPPEILDGASLVPLLRGGSPPERHGLYLETRYPEENFGWASLSGFRDQTWKWIRAPKPELYNLKDDPGERINLVSEYVEIATRFDKRLGHFIQSVGPPASERAGSMSREVEERLRSLGYVSARTLAGTATDELPDPKDMIHFHTDFEEAKLAMEEDRFRDAIQPFQRVLQNNPGNSVARLGLGIALTKTFRFAEAEKVLREALEASPRNATVQVNLADGLFGQGKFQDAVELYRLALRDRAQETRGSHARLIVSLTVLGRSSEADDAMRRALNNLPQDGAFFEDLGRRLSRYRNLVAGVPVGSGQASLSDSLTLELAEAAAGIGLTMEVEERLSQPLRDPNREQARLELLRKIYLESQRPMEALKTLNGLAQLDGWTVQRKESQAEILLMLGRYEEALRSLDDLKRDSSTPRTHLAPIEFYRASALAHLDRKEEALAALRFALEDGHIGPSRLLTDPHLQPMRYWSPFRDYVDSLANWNGQEKRPAESRSPR